MISQAQGSFVRISLKPAFHKIGIISLVAVNNCSDFSYPGDLKIFDIGKRTTTVIKKIRGRRLQV